MSIFDIFEAVCHVGFPPVRIRPIPYVAFSLVVWVVIEMKGSNYDVAICVYYYSVEWKQSEERNTCR